MHLVSNKHQGEHFISELKQADFILIIHGEMNVERNDDFFALLKKIPAIQLVVPLDFSKLKSRENLVFE